jgi:hypothetical protein
MKKRILYSLLLFCSATSFAQQHGYWNNHVGIDAGASFLRFDAPPTALPAGSSSAPGLTGSLFFDFVRMQETPYRDIPVWGFKFKFNLQAVAYKDPQGNKYYADAFTFPVLLKLRLISTSGYYTSYYDRDHNQYIPQYHDRKKFSLFLYAGPQYEYVYGKNNYSDEFSNRSLAGGVYGYFSALTGLEFNFETFLFDLSWQQGLRPVYYDGSPLKSSGLVLRFGLTIPNVYRHYR